MKHFMYSFDSARSRSFGHVRFFSVVASLCSIRSCFVCSVTSVVVLDLIRVFKHVGRKCKEKVDRHVLSELPHRWKFGLRSLQCQDQMSPAHASHTCIAISASRLVFSLLPTSLCWYSTTISKSNASRSELSMALAMGPVVLTSKVLISLSLKSSSVGLSLMHGPSYHAKNCFPLILHE